MEEMDELTKQHTLLSSINIRLVRGSASEKVYNKKSSLEYQMIIKSIKLRE